MTHPTKAIYRWLLADYVKMCNLSLRDKLYDEQDLMRSYNRIEVVDYLQEVEIEGIKFTPYYAGHVLGAAMFLLEIAGVKILYTGDYSREEDRHLMAAECPPDVTPDVLICESTFGVQSHEPLLDREARFTSTVHEIVSRGGRCLLPVFALGRAQEFLLILEEYWRVHPELHDIPIYYASSLAKKSMSVYQTYTNMMNVRIRKAKTSNPFQFRYISNLKSTSHFDDIGPCVMIASPGMLQNGLSRELLELWCTNENNGVIILGYVVEGTLGRHILSRPETIPTMSGETLPMRMSVDYISFAAHVDYPQNHSFIEQVSPQSLVLVHGESNEMMRLKSALRSRYAERNTGLEIYTPKNCESIELNFHRERIVKVSDTFPIIPLAFYNRKLTPPYFQVLGSLAKHSPEPYMRISGILVGRDFSYHLSDVSDLETYTDLRPAEISQKQFLRCYAPANLVFWHLSKMFGRIEIMGKRKAFVFDNVLVEQTENGRLWVLSWKGHPISDTISDSIAGIILMCQTSPASVIETSHTHSHLPSAEGKIDTTGSAADECPSTKVKKLKHMHVGDQHANDKPPPGNYLESNDGPSSSSSSISDPISSDDLGSDYSDSHLVHIGDKMLDTTKHSSDSDALRSTKKDKEDIKSYVSSLLDVTLFLKHQFGKSSVTLCRAFYNNVLVYYRDPGFTFNGENGIKDNSSDIASQSEDVSGDGDTADEKLPGEIPHVKGELASWVITLNSTKGLVSYTNAGVKVLNGPDELKRRVVTVLMRAWRTAFPISETLILE